MMPSTEDVLHQFVMDHAIEEKERALYEGRHAYPYGNPYAVVVGALLEAALRHPQDANLAKWIYSELMGAFQDQAQQQAQECARREEADRLMTEALTVSCPWCGASPGHKCRTANAKATLTTQAHADRLRLARGLFPEERGPVWPSDMDPELKGHPTDPDQLAKLEREARNVDCPWCHADADHHCVSKVGSPTAYHLWRIRAARGVQPLS